MNLKYFLNALSLVSCFSLISGDIDAGINFMTHNLIPVQKNMFEKRIAQNRRKSLFFGLFYDKKIYDISWVDESREIPPRFETLIEVLNECATELRGIITVFITNTDGDSNFLKKQIKQESALPTLVFFPTLPQPPVIYNGKFTRKDIISFMKHYTLGRDIETLDVKSLKPFLAKSNQRPKALLFSTKEHTEFIFRGLSVEFHERLSFGHVVLKEKTDSLDFFRFSSLPQIVIVHPNNPRKPIYYTNKSKSYFDFSNWMNPYAETFIDGGGVPNSGSSVQSRPWENEVIPCLNKLSQQHICFKNMNNANHLCAVYLVEGKSLSDDETTMLEEFKLRNWNALTDKPMNIRWMFMDISHNVEWKKLFSHDVYPSFVIINPHKRVRFASIEKTVVANADTINKLMDRVLNGDARYTRIKSDEFPRFSDIEEEEL